MSEAVDVSEVADDNIKIVIYGENGCGKTTLACKFPKPLLLLSMEPNKTGGALSVTKVAGVKYLRVDSVERAAKLSDELRESNPFRTVVLDSVTSYQDLVLKKILGRLPEQLNWGGVTRDQYRARSEQTKEGLRPFLNLECHVVCVAKQRDHNPPKDDKPEIIQGVKEDGQVGLLQVGSWFAADLGGATVGWLNDAADYIGHMYFDWETKVVEGAAVNGVKRTRVERTGKVIRKLRTGFHPNFCARFRIPTGDDDGDEVNEIEKPTYEKIAALIRGG